MPRHLKLFSRENKNLFTHGANVQKEGCSPARWRKVNREQSCKR